MAQDITKRRKLELSTLHLSQQELLGLDIDIEAFRLVIQNAFQTNVNIADRITGGNVTRTIEGASTLEVTILDDKRSFINSDIFHSKIDVQTEGLWWRLRAFNKQGDNLTLKFEDREVAILRGYDKHIAPINRGTMTRAEFVLRMIKEVKEISIPYYIPELHDPQPVFNIKGAAIYPDERTKGIGLNERLKITDPAGGNSRNAAPDQLAVANAILIAGDRIFSVKNPHRRKFLVCAIMTAIVESQLSVPVGGDLDSKGAFQQRPSQGWPDTTDTVIQANAFYAKAAEYNAEHPGISYGDLCQGVQRSGHGERYALHLVEAQNIVDAFGVVGADAEQPAASFNASQFKGATAGYFFYRGEPPSRKHQQWKPENSWNCISGRLAPEVNWRAFFVSGTFYLISEDDLFKSQPRAILRESADGIDYIDGDYDVNKKVASLDATVRMGKFLIPPGSVVKLEEWGPANGRYIVSTIERDIFSPNGTITIKKPDPILLEPQKGNLQANLIGNAYGGPKVAVKAKSPSLFSTNFAGIFNADAAKLADKIIEYHKQNLYKDGSDSGHSQMNQWRLVAAGKGITNQCEGDGKVFLDIRVPQVVVFLIENGWKVGTSAICADHSCYVDGRPGVKSAHPQGKALDINYLSPNGYPFLQISDPDNITMERDWVPEVMILLQQLDPSQILCNGVAGQDMSAIQACQTNERKQVPSAIKIVGDHTDHIHVGF